MHVMEQYFWWHIFCLLSPLVPNHTWTKYTVPGLSPASLQDVWFPTSSITYMQKKTKTEELSAGGLTAVLNTNGHKLKHKAESRCRKHNHKPCADPNMHAHHIVWGLLISVFMQIFSCNCACWVKICSLLGITGPHMLRNRRRSMRRHSRKYTDRRRK